MEQTMKVNLIEALTRIYGDIGNENTPPTRDFNAANNMKNLASDNKAAILQILTSLQNKVEQLTNKNSSNQSQGGGTNDNQDLPLLNSNTRKTYRRYCWSHGWCSHWGAHMQEQKGRTQRRGVFQKWYEWKQQKLPVQQIGVTHEGVISNISVSSIPNLFNN